MSTELRHTSLVEVVLMRDPSDSEAISWFLSQIAHGVSISIHKPQLDHQVYFAAKGSTTDGIDQDQYFDVKKTISKPSYANDLIKSSAQFGSDVSPDLHIQVHHKIIDVSTLDTTSFKWDDAPSSYQVEAKHTIVSNAKKKHRLCFSLFKEGNEVFRVDFTNAPSSKKSKKTDRRGEVGGVADYNSIPLGLANGNWKILEEKRRHLPTIDQLTNMNKKKDIVTLLEDILRNGRKLISMHSSLNPSVPALPIFIDKNSKKKLRYLNNHHRSKKMISKLTRFQVETYYRELLVMASWDYLETLHFLNQTGLDKFYFGKKLPSYEKIPLPISSPDLNIRAFLTFLKNHHIDLDVLAKRYFSLNPSLDPLPQT